LDWLCRKTASAGALSWAVFLFPIPWYAAYFNASFLMVPIWPGGAAILNNNVFSYPGVAGRLNSFSPCFRRNGMVSVFLHQYRDFLTRQVMKGNHFHAGLLALHPTLVKNSHPEPGSFFFNSMISTSFPFDEEEQEMPADMNG
jgi:hypothetical protein